MEENRQRKELVLERDPEMFKKTTEDVVARRDQLGI